MVPRPRREPPSKFETCPPPPPDREYYPLEIKASDLRVSGFSRRGSGCHVIGGPPGGHIFEKASSRHARHRAIYRSSADGRAVADNAIPLGGGAEHRRAGCSNPWEGSGMAKTGSINYASGRRRVSWEIGGRKRFASNGPGSDTSETNMHGSVATQGSPSPSNAAISRPGNVSGTSIIDTIKVIQVALLRESARPVEASRTGSIIALLKKLDNVDVSVDVLSRTRIRRSLTKINKYNNVAVHLAVDHLNGKWSAISGRWQEELLPPLG
ncbi:hypothetical protein ACHAXA_001844 [Cyclostephanos tholiformis]|uniref:TFIIS N-terminal domain-containing protein n=1 Tax=Cyclostephanos tholiformis TaxID=382380 RepID=A0ABD3RIJ3_9STRA